MILVLTPLKFEFDALLPSLTQGLLETSRQESFGRVKVSRFSNFAVATAGHGKVQFALTTQHLIRALNPELVVCAGACGALEPGVRALDLVVGVETVEHDFHLLFEKRPQPLFTASPTYIDKLRTAALPVDHQIHFGRIASGDEDIIETSRAESLRAKTGAIAVAWEGAGGARAAAFCDTQFLELRLVTDTADQHAPYDFQKNVRSGMVNISRALLHLST